MWKCCEYMQHRNKESYNKYGKWINNNYVIILLLIDCFHNSCLHLIICWIRIILNWLNKMGKFILGRFRRKKNGARVSVCIRRAKFTKGSLWIIRGLVMGFRYIRMAICTLGSSWIIKSMAKDSSFGSISMSSQSSQSKLQNIIKVNGGEDCQMDKESIKRTMVNYK